MVVPAGDGMTHSRPSHHDDRTDEPFEGPVLSDAPGRGGAARSTALVGSGGSRRWAGAFATLVVLVAGFGLAGRLGVAPPGGGSSSATDAPAPPGSAGASAGAATGGEGRGGPTVAGSPLPGELFVTDPRTLAPRAVLMLPVEGSSWTDVARVPVAGTVSNGATQVWVTVTSDRLLLGQASLQVGSEGRFAGFVEIAPPMTRQPAEVRAIEPGPAPELLALVPISVGTSRRLLVSNATTTAPGPVGPVVQLDGLVRRDVSRVTVRLETAFGPARSTVATLDPPVPAATGFLALWRTFRASVRLPRGATCGDAWLAVSGTWPSGDGAESSARARGPAAGAGHTPGPSAGAASAVGASGDEETVPICLH